MMHQNGSRSESKKLILLLQNKSYHRDGCFTLNNSHCHTVCVSPLLTISGTVAFEADLSEYTSIPIDSYVIFEEIHTNIGQG